MRKIVYVFMALVALFYLIIAISQAEDPFALSGSVFVSDSEYTIIPQEWLDSINANTVSEDMCAEKPRLCAGLINTFHKSYIDEHDRFMKFVQAVDEALNGRSKRLNKTGGKK